MPQTSSAVRFAQGEVPTTATAVYTVVTGGSSILASISFTSNRTSNTDTLVELWIAPSGQAQTTSNRFLAVTLKDGMSYREAQLGIVLASGDRLFIRSNQTLVSYFISGAELVTV